MKNWFQQWHGLQLYLQFGVLHLVLLSLALHMLQNPNLLQMIGFLLYILSSWHQTTFVHFFEGMKLLFHFYLCKNSPSHVVPKPVVQVFLVHNQMEEVEVNLLLTDLPLLLVLLKKKEIVTKDLKQ
jgi:hypothetical protein